MTAAIATGRFGPTYAAVDSATGTRVAVRAITEPLSPEGRDRLLEALRRLCDTPLDHPSIGRALDCGIDGDVPYLVHALLPGRTVDEYLASAGPRPLSEIALRVTHLAAAIDYAAAAGVHHGAMAPGDVVFAAESSGVAGFGLVQALRDAGAAVNEPTAADDIYSLAAMTYELLAGRPYGGGDLAHAVAQLPATEPCNRRALAAALDSALSPDPARWPSTALQFAGALHDAQSVEPVMGRLAFDEEARPEETAQTVVAAPRAQAARPRYADPDFHGSGGMAPAAGRLLFDAPLYGSDTADIADTPTVVVHPDPAPARTIRFEQLQEDDVEPDAPLHAARPGIDAGYNAERPAPFVLHDRSSQGPRVALVVVALLLAVGAGTAWFLLDRAEPPPATAAPGTGIEPEPDRVQVDDPVGGSATPEPPSSAAGPVPSEPVPSVSAPPVGQASASPAERATPDGDPPAASSVAGAPVRPAGGAVQPTPGPGRADVRAEPATPPGRVLVRSNPPGAQVLVDGQPHGVTPIAIRGLELGTRTIAVVAPGYASWQQPVTLTAEQPARSFDLTLAPGGSSPETQTAAVPADGALVIDSRPAGARVWMDGALVGTTPMVLSSVGAGAHAVRIEMDGYRPWSTSVQVNRGERARVAASLER